MINLKGPNEIYDKKVSNNYSYGWWMRDGVEKEQWTKNNHHPMVRSEMTRYCLEFYFEIVQIQFIGCMPHPSLLCAIIH
jgi:hypothetical protein